jgi:lipopolysaccharide export system permease protein
MAVVSLTILDRYIIRQLLVLVAFALLIFTVVWIAPEILLEAIQETASGRLTLWQGLQFVVLQLPEVLIYSIPIASMIAALFFFRRFSLSSELTAVQASGVSMRRILRPVAMVGLMMSLMFLLNQEVVAPTASKAFNQLRYAIGMKKPNPADRFLTLTESNEHNALSSFRLFSREASAGELAMLSVELLQEGAESRIHQLITAQKATWEPGASQWRLKDATRYDVSPEGVYEKITNEPETVLPTRIPVSDYMAFSYQLPIEMTMGQLFEHIRILEVMSQFDQARYYTVRFFQRFFHPLAPLVLMLISVGFAVERVRAKWNIGLLIAAVLLIAYNISISVMTSVGSLGVLPPLVAAAIPLLLVTLMAQGATQLRRLGG